MMEMSEQCSTRMQRLWLGKLRQHLSTTITSSSTTAFLPLHHRRALHHRPLDSHFSIVFSYLSRTRQNPHLGFQSVLPLSVFRGFASKSKEKRLKRTTPAVSKLKKYKIKPYSSFKSRFRTLNDGTIRRWHAGKRHNAHLKSKISKRRLRLPALVHPAYAKVMKKLNFYG